VIANEEHGGIVSRGKALLANVDGYVSSHSSTVIGMLVTLRASVTDDCRLEQEVGIFNDIAEQIFSAG